MTSEWRIEKTELIIVWILVAVDVAAWIYIFSDSPDSPGSISLMLLAFLTIYLAYRASRGDGRAVSTLIMTFFLYVPFWLLMAFIFVLTISNEITRNILFGLAFVIAFIHFFHALVLMPRVSKEQPK